MPDIPCPPLSDAAFSAWAETGAQARAARRVGRVLPDLPRPTFDGPEYESDAWRAAKSRELAMKGNRDRFDAMCPPALLPSRANWSHPDIKPYTAQITAIRDWTSTSFAGKGILAAGPTYRGKSRALWSLIERLQVTEAKRCSFFTATDFFARLGEQVNYGRDDARTWVDGIASLPLLFLDDLGQEAVGAARADVCRQWFHDLLDRRRGLMLPLFVTTNLTANEIAGGAEGEQVRRDPMLSRLLDLCHPIKF